MHKDRAFIRLHKNCQTTKMFIEAKENIFKIFGKLFVGL